MNEICLQCFHAMPSNAPCPRCGWTRETSHNPSGALPMGSILAQRYQIGGVVQQDRERIVYRAWDSNERKPVELMEYLPPGAVRQGRSFSSSSGVKKRMRQWKHWGAFLQNGTVYALALPAKPAWRKKLWAALVLLGCVLGFFVWGAVAWQSRAKVWLPASAPQEYVSFLSKRFRVTVIEDTEYTPRLMRAAQEGNLPDVFYREGFQGELDQIACPVDLALLETGDCYLADYSKAYPSRLEVPTGWYVTVAYTHTNEKTVSPAQLFSGNTAVCVAEDNWDDLMLVWTGGLSGVASQLRQVEAVYQKQQTDPNQEAHFDLFANGTVDWLVDDTLQRAYLTQYGSLVPLCQQGRIAGCYAAHWCLGTDGKKSYQVLETLLSQEGQEVLFPAGQAFLPLSAQGLEQVVKHEPQLVFLTQRETYEFILYGESREVAYRKNNEMYQEVKENYEK